MTSASYDTKIDDTKRREHGAFYTPLVWAKKADEIMKQVIAPDYKDKFVIWDPACGTKNLTRLFNYKKLYSSTIFNRELELSQDYNTNSTAFQYDFLSDDFDLNRDSNNFKMPKSLFNALSSDKPIIFYMNPPYGTTGKLAKDGTAKKIDISKANLFMKANNYGNASQQLYAQFVARVIKLADDFNLTNVYLAMFSGIRYLTGGNYWLKFDQHFFKHFTYKYGMIFNAGEFSGTSSMWPIGFTIYKLNKNENNIPKEFELSIMTRTDSSINNVDTKTVNLVEKDSLSSWLRTPAITGTPMPDGSYPKLTSAMKESERSNSRCTFYEGSMGCLMNSANNVAEGTTNGGVWLATSGIYHDHGVNVFDKNFDKVVADFAIRRSVSPTWINAQDNFLKPNTNSPIYSSFIGDATVFSLFDSASNQASYRNWNGYTNCNKPDRWINQWFFIDQGKIETEAMRKKQNDVAYDAYGDKNRYVYLKLQSMTLSKEAQNVLDLATKLYFKQLKYRKKAILKYPDMSLNAWDIGWYQMKLIDRAFPSKVMQELKSAIIILKEKIAREYAQDLIKKVRGN